MKKVLFVCTGNSCRSVMAEGLMNKLAAEQGLDIQASSAGVSAMDGFGPTFATIRVMAFEGIDMTSHRARRLTAAIVEENDLILAMEPMHKSIVLSISPQAQERTFLLTEYENPDFLGEGIKDPINSDDEFYKETLDSIREHIERILDKLKEQF